MKGNEAIAEAAVRGGCRFFAGYPITPQNEIPEYLSWRLFEVGGQFVQSESEVAAINMVYGAAAAGTRAMTSSSSPGISLKQEGISYIAGAELPCVIINMVRGGPGLGGIQPAQSDYFQATKGGGHGDYHMLVYGPNSVQECVDILYNAFDKADEYRIPVMILGDGMLGQIMEAVELPEMKDIEKLPKKDWAATGSGVGENRRIVNSLYIEPDALEELNHRQFEKYDLIASRETRYEEYLCDDAEIVAVYAGSCERSYNRLFHARPRHPGIVSDGHPDVSRVLSQTLNQPYGKTVGDGGNCLIGKRNRHILYALERNSADIASAFEFLPLFVKHVFHRSLKIL